jgi:hypothetical protein
MKIEFLSYNLILMTIFTLVKVEAFETSSTLWKLLRNGRCFVDEFVEEVKKDKNLKQEWLEILATIHDAASGKLLPQKRFKKLSLAKSFEFQAYEAKSFSLRLYIITEHKIGKILICGGRKKTQIKDIERLKRIIKEYSHFKN